MADITVDVNLPSSVSVDVTSPTQSLATNISIPGPQGPRGEKGNPTSINNLTAENIIITGSDGNVAYTSGTSTIFISGNSGYFQSAVNSLTTNLNSTGANLNTSINNLSGLFTGYTGNLDNNYATDAQLANTGSTLNTKIDNLSGYVNSQDSNISNNLSSTGSSLQTNINTLSSNLNSTGSNLENKITSLSGTLTGNYLTTNSASSTYATITNLNSTGSTLNSSISSLSGTLTSDYATIINLASTGSNLQNQINNLDNVYATDASVTSVANNLASTGNALETKIGSLSGTLTSSYATISNLALTGSNLNTKIDNFSGTYQNFVDNLDSSYATDVQLQNTGTSLNNSISSLSGTLTSNYATISDLASTGSTLVNTISSLSGTLTSNYATINNLNSTGSTLETSIASTGNTLNLSINSLSGTLTSTYATITNLASTGSTLNNSINSLSGTLTSTYATINNLASTGSTLATNLANTGSNLDAKINALSGSAVLLYGNQTINGLKDFTTRPTVNTTPVLLSGENANGLTVLVKNDESTTLLKGQPVYIYGANGNNILVRKASNTGEAYSSKTLGLLAQDLTSNAQGLVITEGSLEGINTNAGNAGDPIWLGPTGDLIFGLAQKPYAPNHLVYLGVIERKQSNNGKIYVKVQNGFELHELHNVNINHKNVLNDNDIIRYNSASGLWFNETLNTGIFQTQINSLSGSSVLLYGDQSVGGVKTFRDNVYINNLFVTGTETIVNTNNFNVQSPYILLNLTGGAVDGGIFFVTGSGLTGVNDTGPIIGFDHSNKFKFGVSTRNSDLSTLPDIASVQDITAYSGFVDGKYSTIINLASTGSTLSTNLASTGSTLQTNINNLSNTYATITNLGLTGSTLVTNLASTGSTLDTKINNLSGVSVLTFGNQNISGIKTFNNGLATTYISGVSGSSLDIIGFSGRSVNINAGNSLVGSNAGDVTLTAGNSPTLRGSINLIAGTGGQGVGIVSPGINLYAGQSPTYDGNNNIFGNINVNKFLTFQPIGPKTISIYRSGQGQEQKLGVVIDNNKVDVNNGMLLQVSGVNVSPTLYASITNLASTGSTLATNLASTGSTLNSSINSLSGLFTGYTGTLDNNYATDSQLASTGSTLVGSISSLSGTLTSTYATITNLASTGSTLNTKIDNLSGYINSSSSNIVFTTGDQTISGVKSFAQDTTFGDTGQGDFLVISGNQFTVYGSGNFTSGLFVNSSPVLTGSSTLYATTVNLASTGSTLDDKINNLSGVSVLRFGDQTISGVKTFETGVNIRGDVGIGTITPAAKLHIAGLPALLNTNMEDILYLQRPFNAGVAFGSRAVFRLGRYNTFGGSSLTRLDIALRSGADNATNVNAPEINVMTLRADGRVGIGTTTPSETLTVAGNTNISGNLTVSGSINISGNYDLYSQIENAKKLALAYAIAL